MAAVKRDGELCEADAKNHQQKNENGSSAEREKRSRGYQMGPDVSENRVAVRDFENSSYPPPAGIIKCSTTIRRIEVCDPLHRRQNLPLYI